LEFKKKRMPSNRQAENHLSEGGDWGRIGRKECDPAKKWGETKELLENGKGIRTPLRNSDWERLEARGEGL